MNKEEVKESEGKERPYVCVHAKKVKEEVTEASNYDLYHKDFSSAVQHAIQVAKKRGYEVDMDDWHNKVASGPRKPSEGNTNSYSIKLTKNGKEQKKALQMQVYNKGGSKPYELNMYIESVDGDEAIIENKEYGYEGDMAISQLRTIVRNAEHLAGILEPDTDLPEWVQSKITLAEDYIKTAHNYMMSEMERSSQEEEPRNPAIIPRGYEKLKKENWVSTLPAGRRYPFIDFSDLVTSGEQPVRESAESKLEVHIPMYVQEAAYEGNIGMMELAKFYMKASDEDKKKLQDAIKNKRFKEAWKMVEKVTGVRLVGKEFHEDAAVAANAVSGGGVDMNPTGVPKWDKRSKFHVDHLFRRADGTKYTGGKKKDLNETD